MLGLLASIRVIAFTNFNLTNKMNFIAIDSNDSKFQTKGIYYNYGCEMFRWNVVKEKYDNCILFNTLFYTNNFIRTRGSFLLKI